MCAEAFAQLVPHAQVGRSTGRGEALPVVEETPRDLGHAAARAVEQAAVHVVEEEVLPVAPQGQDSPHEVTLRLHLRPHEGIHVVRH